MKSVNGGRDRYRRHTDSDLNNNGTTAINDTKIDLDDFVREQDQARIKY